MKKKLLSSLLLVISSIILPSAVSAKTDVYKVPIREEQNEDNHDIPRAPIVAPISAYVDTDLEELILWANCNCGIINISGYNSTSGSTFSAQSTSLGSGDSFSVSIPWTLGPWTITFTFENGDIFYGNTNF